MQAFQANTQPQYVAYNMPHTLPQTPFMPRPGIVRPTPRWSTQQVTFFLLQVENKAYIYYISQVIDMKFKYWISLSTQAWFDQSDQPRMDQFEPSRQFSDLEPSPSINHAPFEAVKISSTKQMCETRSLLRYSFKQFFNTGKIPRFWTRFWFDFSPNISQRHSPRNPPPTSWPPRCSLALLLRSKNRCSEKDFTLTFR